VKDEVRIEFDIVVGLVSAASKRLRASLMNVSKANAEMQSKSDRVGGWTAGGPIKSDGKHRFHKIRLKELGSTMNRPCLVQKRSEANLRAVDVECSPHSKCVAVSNAPQYAGVY
jgi:hypothetical protein